MPEILIRHRHFFPLFPSNFDLFLYFSQVLDTLIKTSDGDLRRAITYLQSASRLHSVTGQEKSSVTPRSIVEIAGVVPDEIIHNLCKAMGIEIYGKDGENVEMKNGEEDDVMIKGKKGGFEAVRRVVKETTMEGYSSTQILIQVSKQDGTFERKRHCNTHLLTPSVFFDLVHSFTITSSFILLSLQSRNPRLLCI